MNLLRNPEVKLTLLLCIIVSAVSSVAAFLFDIRCGLLTVLLCAFFIAIFIVNTNKRYQNISLLAQDIDRILHTDGSIVFNNYSEGELSLLQSEIHKMTVRLNEQSSRLAEDKKYLSDSIADIAHQIRTPLTSINLLVSLLSEDGLTDERRKKLSHDLFRLLSRIDSLITSLLKISKLDAGTVEFKPESLSLKDFLEKAASPVEIPMDLKNQSLKITADGMLCTDPLWSTEAITNIIKNCMEHTPDGGAIEINAEENPLYSEIIIKDNGSGIDSEDLPHIFERFYKGKNSDNNSFGIGLALSRMIISSQNGTIKAENRPEGGAMFTIRFFKGIV